MTRYRLLAIFLLIFIIQRPAGAQAQYENQAVILQYHHVSTQTPPVTSLSPAAFKIHMDYLADNGFTIRALESVIEDLKNGSRLADKTAVITFDDGYTSVYEVAFPLLKERGWPFTVFVTSGLVGSNDRLYSTWEQISEMAAEGGTIANHTVSHPYLLDGKEGNKSQWLANIRSEITEAEESILIHTGQSHKLLAYPYGEYNPEIQDLVRELGYVGIAQHSGPINSNSDFTALPRFPFSGIYASMNTFPTKVMSLAFTLDNVSPLSPITASKSPGAKLDFTEGHEGLSQLACFNNSQMIELKLVDAEQAVYEVNTPFENLSRRFRYNCTAPGKGGRYFWYSIPWVNPAIEE